MLFNYRAYGLNICSEIPIPELPPILEKNLKINVKISLRKINLPPKASIEGRNVKATNKVIYRFWDGIGKFELIDGKEIFIDPDVNADLKILRRFLLGTVLAVFLYQRGFFVMHASAINIQNGAIAILGKSGSGKSSTAMEFYKNGYPVVADDFIAIQFQKDGTPIVTPGFPKLKLSYDYIISNKIDLEEVLYLDSKLKSNYVNVAKGFPQTHLKLKRIYILEKGDNLNLKQINPQEIFKKLLSNTFAVNMLHNLGNGRNLDYYSNITKKVPIKSLMIPRSFQMLPPAIKLVETDILDKDNITNLE